jgi:hypothetical protein
MGLIEILVIAVVVLFIWHGLRAKKRKAEKQV